MLQRYDQFLDLSLPLPPSNYSNSYFSNDRVTPVDCLKLFIQPEELSGNEAWHCPPVQWPLRRGNTNFPLAAPGSSFSYVQTFHLSRPKFQDQNRQRNRFSA